eukprot:scaffold127611_cov45-Tisochrysis_lutea.AAC.1
MPNPMRTHKVESETTMQAAETRMPPPPLASKASAPAAALDTTASTSTPADVYVVPRDVTSHSSQMAPSSDASASGRSWVDQIKEAVSKCVTQTASRFGGKWKAVDVPSSKVQDAENEPMSAYQENFRAKLRAHRTHYRVHRHVAVAGYGGKNTSSFWVRQRSLS